MTDKPTDESTPMSAMQEARENAVRWARTNPDAAAWWVAVGMAHGASDRAVPTWFGSRARLLVKALLR